MKDRAAQLYQAVIMEHSKHPYHFEKKEDADHVLEAYNQFCGDHFHLYLYVGGAKITEAFFHGYGCAISKASSSVLTQVIEGKALKELPAILSEFRQIVHPDGEPQEGKHEQFLAFAAAQKFPGRDKCALLSWQTLEEWLIKTGS